MSEKSTRDDAETFDVVVTRVLGTPVEEAWKAWSDPAYVTHLDPAALGMPPGVPHDVPHEITFEATDVGMEMTVTEHGYTTEEARDLSKVGMEQCLHKMAAMFAGAKLAFQQVSTSGFGLQAAGFIREREHGSWVFAEGDSVMPFPDSPVTYCCAVNGVYA